MESRGHGSPWLAMQDEDRGRAQASAHVVLAINLRCLYVLAVVE